MPSFFGGEGKSGEGKNCILFPFVLIGRDDCNHGGQNFNGKKVLRKKYMKEKTAKKIEKLVNKSMDSVIKLSRGEL